MSGTKIFKRNRAIGYVTNHIPASVRYIRRRKENVIVTCVGKAFHTYSANHFRLICVSGLHPEDISCIASDNYLVYSASGKNIYGWRSGNVIRHVYKGHEKNIHLLLPFGKHLISIDDDNILKVFDVDTEAVYLDLPFQANNFKISALMHPSTYINKILLGSCQGGLQLWNIKESKLVYTFNSVESKILVLEQAPAIDVCAIGLQDGKIILLNLKFDEKIMQFSQEWGPVTGISFRTDGHPIMTTSSTNGQIVLWNLEEKKIASQLVAHEDSVTTTTCFPSEPLMLTTSPDNSMKLWIFDMPDGGARLLRIREGHASPPLCIRYHGSSGQNLLSAGEDSSLRIFNTVIEQLSKSLGKASYNRKASKRRNRFQEDPFKMPPIIQFTSETTREKEWDNIAAIHSGVTVATTWSYNKTKMGDLKLIPEKFQNKNRKSLIVEATCISLTNCGNFVNIGYSTGDVDRFNIQSGIHRATYGSPAHKTAVRGVSSDNLNQFVVSGGADGFLKFWNFKGKVNEPIAEMNLNEGIILFVSHRESAMLCVALEDYTVNIVDCDTRNVVRKFKGHTATITDACFSPDSRWLITSSMDCTIKVWDIPSSYLVDHFKVEYACTSLSMSPTGNFLATSHVNFLGIYLWANKTLFSHISLRSIKPDAEAPLVDLPSTTRDEGEKSLEENMVSLELEELGEELELDYSSPLQLDSKLITMSNAAASKWQNLLNLDVIKKRNKPKAPPKAPKQAPFFLPTLSGLEVKFDLSNASNNNDSRLMIQSNMENFTIFGRMLKESKDTENYQISIDHLMSLGPSMIDFEIKSMSPFNGGSISIMSQFIKVIIFMFETNVNFELAQSYLGVFLKTHSHEIAESATLRNYLEDLEAAQKKGWKILEENLLYGIGVVRTLRNFV